MSDSDWEGPEEGGIKFMDEINALERAGFGHISAALGTKIGKGGEDLEKLGRILADPVDRFVAYLNGIYFSLVRDEIIDSISSDQLEVLYNKPYTVKNVEKLNPTAFLIGYYASNFGRGISKETINRYIGEPALKASYDANSIEPEDVLRYARLWMT